MLYLRCCRAAIYRYHSSHRGATLKTRERVARGGLIVLSVVLVAGPGSGAIAFVPTVGAATPITAIGNTRGATASAPAVRLTPPGAADSAGVGQVCDVAGRVGLAQWCRVQHPCAPRR